MRVSLHYLFILLAGTFYAGEVCPLLEGLVTWKLGAVILACLVPALALRPVLMRLVVEPLATTRRPVRQFLLDLALFAAAGLGMAVANAAAFGFPILGSGLKLTLGVTALGFFAAADMSMARERAAILAARDTGAGGEPPARMVPLTRKFSLLAVVVACITCALLLLVIRHDISWMLAAKSHLSAAAIRRAVLGEIAFVVGVLFVLVLRLLLAYARNLQLLFDIQTGVLQAVSSGRLDVRAPVVTEDEMGLIAGHTNRMIRGLKDRLRMKEGLLVAREIQRGLLPGAPPPLPGLELAAKCDYSDETGGDFYDFIPCGVEACGGRTAVVVGDVTGHGVGAALLMASVRALLRSRAARPGTAGEIARDVNRLLVSDTVPTARFCTLFLLLLEPEAGRMSWCSAGHGPALLVRPGADVERLGREGGVPLGIDEDRNYDSGEGPLPAPGEVLCIGTDGIWEAQAADGSRYGTGRLVELVAEYAAQGPEVVVRTVLDDVRAFSRGGAARDDATLLVIRGVEG